MPSMPYYFLGKGSQFGTLDAQFSGTEEELRATYDAALERIAGDDSIEELAARHVDGRSSDGLTATDVRHFRQHWLRDWWQGKDVEAVLRAGFKEAITRARDASLPIETFWVCANEDAFQVYIVEGTRQITVVVFTPPPVEHVVDEELTALEPIHVVKVRDEYDKGEFDVIGTSSEGEIITKQLRFAPDPQHTRPVQSS